MPRKDLFDLDERVVVITGGLGQIGRQFALELIDRGARVAIFNRRIPDQATLAERFPVDSGRVAFFAVDITDKVSVTAGFDGVVAQWGVPHVLVNKPDSTPSRARRLRFRDRSRTSPRRSGARCSRST
jgi:NAD(P)-dependent dehydrogenase (short-subunit alcohol dehydrogenase family)